MTFSMFLGSALLVIEILANLSKMLPTKKLMSRISQKFLKNSKSLYTHFLLFIRNVEPKKQLVNFITLKATATLYHI